VLPPNYESLSAEAKEEILYQAMIATTFKELPSLERVNPLKFVLSHMSRKLGTVGDEAPQGYEKAIHAHGVAAKVRFESEPTSPYTGMFKGAPHGIVRISVTSDPEGKDFAPGLALKLLVDGRPSQNVSFLFKLSGQKDNHNFFANELSNIIPVEFDPKSLFSSTVFSRVSLAPTKLSVKPFAAVDAKGIGEMAPKAPVQVYLVPSQGHQLATAVHDFRDDFLKLPSNSVLYDVYATSDGGANPSHSDSARARRAAAVKIGRLVTSSPFLASSFGDGGLFFRHYRFDDN